MDESNKLKINFNEIKNLRESVENLLKSLNDKINTLNIIYKDLISNNINETQNGLDSLHFQSKLINYEIENNYEIFNMIDNHMYCNYYKLYKNILKYLEDNVTNRNITSGFLNKNYPVYKDLDVNTKYDFETIIEIYNTIIQILDILNNEYMTREHKFELENNRKKTGLNIDNLVNSLKFNNETMKNNINLFIQYLCIFNNFHQKYLTRFSLRTKLFYGQINNDIHLEESKNNVNYSIEDDNIILENDEEDNIRQYISSCHDVNEELDTQKEELNNIISGINITPQASCSTLNKSPSSEKDSLPSLSDITTKKEASCITDLNDINNNLFIINERKQYMIEKKFKNNFLENDDLEYNINNNCIVL
tara:strand:+ start:6460 stop:7551 length:1092 start_codon:yes stop_codon:yes gene_type:complete